MSADRVERVRDHAPRHSPPDVIDNLCFIQGLLRHHVACLEELEASPKEVDEAERAVGWLYQFTASLDPAPRCRCITYYENALGERVVIPEQIVTADCPIHGRHVTSEGGEADQGSQNDDTVTAEEVERFRTMSGYWCSPAAHTAFVRLLDSYSAKCLESNMHARACAKAVEMWLKCKEGIR